MKSFTICDLCLIFYAACINRIECAISIAQMRETRRYFLHLLRKCQRKRSLRFRCRKDDSTNIVWMNDWTWLRMCSSVTFLLMVISPEVLLGQTKFCGREYPFCLLQNATWTVLTFVCGLLSASSSMSDVKHRHNK